MNRQAVGTHLAALAGPDVVVGVADPRDPADGLWPEEAAAIKAALPQRRAEFAAGRRAARAALQQARQPATAIRMGAQRAPVWPEGLVGSIAHTDTIALAAVSRSLRGLGIDVEPATALADDLTGIICTPSERGWLATLPEGQRRKMAKHVFCAKEAYFKAQFPQTHEMIDFQAVCVQTAGVRAFDISPAVTVPALPLARCHVDESEGFILAAAWLV